MKFKQLLFVALAVGLLYWLTQGLDTGTSEQLDAERSYFPELDTERISKLRLDHSTRITQVTLERLDAQRWALTDPVAYPASGAMVRNLTGFLKRDRLAPVDWLDRAEAGLDPAPLLLEVTEELESGEHRRFEVRFGNLDVDQAHVFVEIDGELLRAPRGIYDLLQSNADQYRERRLLTALPRDVIALRRSGELPPLEAGTRGNEDPVPAFDLGFRATLDGDTWRLEAPYKSRLELAVVYPLLASITQMNAAGFADDAPLDLAPYGLDPPLATIELDLIDGSQTGLELGFSPAHADREVSARDWHVRRLGQSTVVRVEWSSAVLMLDPIEDFLDQDALRFIRREARAFELSLGDRRRRFEWRKENWYVGAGAGADERAEPGPVLDLLADLEDLTVVRFLPDVEADPEGLVFVELADGRRIGGELGPPHELKGYAGRLFRRFDEDLWGFLLSDDDPTATLELPESTYYAIELFALPENRQARIEARRPGGEWIVWVRDSDRGVWRERDEELEDFDFGLQADALTHPRARVWLAPDEGEPATLEVRVVPNVGEPHLMELRPGEHDDQPVWIADYRGRRAAVAPQAYDFLDGRLP